MSLLGYNVTPNDGDDGSDRVPVGTILHYVGTTAPTNYLICDGSGYNTFIFPELYKVIGDLFGKFTPNLKGCTVRGLDPVSLDFDEIGKGGGLNETMLTITNLPAHAHEIYRGGSQANRGSTNSDWIGTPNVDTNLVDEGVLYFPDQGYPNSGTPRVQAIGKDNSGQVAVSIINTYMVLNFIIKAR